MRRFLLILALILGFGLASCQIPLRAQVPLSQSTPNTPLPQVKTAGNANDAVNTVPTLPTITPTPTPISEPVQLTATVWEELPRAPVLMYHRFNPQPGARSYRYTTSLADFDQQLHALYEAGFSLVSLSDWLRGNIHLQAGRRPLIITIDDLFYGDQISLDDQGQPARYSGVGHLWHFSEDHPDFNFEVALFYNMGDKGYANHYESGSFYVRDGWRQARAEVIVWCIENGAMPLNHFYEHPFLNQISPSQIQWQMEENDKALREALALVGREDLNKKLPNILALPYVVWPDTEEGKQVLYNYVNPEGAPVAAIIEGDYAGGAKYFQAPFSHEFNRWHVPRISVSSQSIATIIEQADQIPTAANCSLGEFRGNPHILPDVISGAILNQINSGACPYGYYVVNQFAFYVQEDVIIQYAP
jgi:hypothetical protein